jgi:hypothetical protein
LVLDEKQQFKVYISPKVIERFKYEIAINRETISRGLISQEVEKALNQYIAFQRAQRTQQQNTRRRDRLVVEGLPPKVYQLREDIYKYLIDCEFYLEVPQCIPEKHLIQAISTLRGTDKRTIFKWIRILKQYKVIKESGVHEYEFLSFITIDSQEHYSDGKPP